MADTRKDKRAPVSLKVRFKSATVDEFIEHYCKDVSRGGIFIKSSQPMPVGTLLKFQFQLKDESALIRGVGRVVWTRAEEDAGADQPAGMGIKFIKMDNESRAMVERIVDGHTGEEGTYESGRETATTTAASSSAPPAPEGGNFFPDLPPAELPLPEDRTAVRQAAQFLAAALSEGGTDEAAAREAQQKAAEARKRSEEIEAQRKLEADQKKRKEPEPAPEPLPSMIIDPSLESRAGSEAERPTDVALTPVRDSMPVAQARHKVGGTDEREPDTEPPPAMPVQATTTTTSIPHGLPAPSSRPNYLPIAIIAAVLTMAAVVALRGGPKELPVTSEAPAAEPAAPATIAPAPAEPSDEAVAPDQPEPREAVVDAAVEAAGEPGDKTAVATPSDVALVRVEVVTTPRGARVFVGGEERGSSPLELDLPAGAPVVVSARAPGHAEAREELTPKGKLTPVRLKLKPLPYIVSAETTPPGAAINVGGHRGTTPVELKLDQPPTSELSVNAKLAGFETARMRLAPTAFSEVDGAMRAKLTLTLDKEAEKEPAPAAAPAKPRAKKSATPDGEAAAAPSGAAAEPAKEEPKSSDPPTKAEPPKAEEPKKGEEPAKSEQPQNALPDNPFPE